MEGAGGGGLYSRISRQGFIGGQINGERSVESDQFTTNSEGSLDFLSSCFTARSLN